MDTLFPKVLQAVAGEDFTVYLYFNDGSVRLYDAKPLLALGGVFAPLQDEAFFKSRLTVLNDTAAWDVTGFHQKRDIAVKNVYLFPFLSHKGHTTPKGEPANDHTTAYCRDDRHHGEFRFLF